MSERLVLDIENGGISGASLEVWPLWFCPSCGVVSQHQPSARLVVCECGVKCSRLSPGGSSGFSRRRSFSPWAVDASIVTRNGAGRAQGVQGELFFSGVGGSK